MNEFEKPYVSVIRLGATNVIATSGTKSMDSSEADNETRFNALYGNQQ